MAIPRKPLNAKQVQQYIDGLQNKASVLVTSTTDLDNRTTALDVDINGNPNADNLDAVRKERSRRLTVCDFTVMSDCQATEACQALYATYRQELRDLPNAEGFDPEDFIWPTEPEYVTE